MMTNGASCTGEMNCRIALPKAAFNKKKKNNLFTSKLDLKFKDETSKMANLVRRIIRV